MLGNLQLLQEKFREFTKSWGNCLCKQRFSGKAACSIVKFVFEKEPVTIVLAWYFSIAHL